MSHPVTFASKYDAQETPRTPIVKTDCVPLTRALVGHVTWQLEYFLAQVHAVFQCCPVTTKRMPRALVQLGTAAAGVANKSVLFLFSVLFVTE